MKFYFKKAHQNKRLVILLSLFSILIGAFLSFNTLAQNVIQSERWQIENPKAEIIKEKDTQEEKRNGTAIIGGVDETAFLYNNKKSLAQDSKGRIWLAYHKKDQQGTYQIFLAASTQAKTNWREEQITFAKDKNHQQNPVIIIDNFDNLYLIWRGQGWGENPDYQNIQYKKRTFLGWEKQEAVTDKSRHQYYPSAGIDSRGDVHICWSGQGWGENPDYQNIQYRRKTASGWQKIESVTDQNQGQFFCALAIDSKDTLHLAWSGQGWGDYRDYYNLQYRRKTISGWQKQQALTNVMGDQGTPAFFIDASDNLHIAWAGTGWKKNKNISNIQYLSFKKFLAWEIKNHFSITDKKYNQLSPQFSLNKQRLLLIWSGLGWGENKDYYNLQMAQEVLPMTMTTALSDRALNQSTPSAIRDEIIWIGQFYRNNQEIEIKRIN